MAIERRDIMVIRFLMQTRSNIKLRSYKTFDNGRRKLIRVLHFREVSNSICTKVNCQKPVRIQYNGRYYHLHRSEIGTVARYL